MVRHVGPAVCDDAYVAPRRSIVNTLLRALTIIVVLVVIFNVFRLGPVANWGNDITKSTIQREPLEKKYVVTTGEWLRDDIGWIRSQSTVKSGLKYFYDKTGVCPYLVITETVNGSYTPTGQEVWDYGNQVYDELFEDEGHMVFVFQCKDEGTEYNMAAVTGAQAKTVLDDEALEILYDYFDSYFWSDRDEDDLFDDAFRSAADRIMKKTPDYKLIILGTVGVGVLGIVVVKLVQGKYNRERERAEETERILNTPVEKIGDSDVDDLKAKYRDTSGPVGSDDTIVQAKDDDA